MLSIVLVALPLTPLVIYRKMFFQGKHKKGFIVPTFFIISIPLHNQLLPTLLQHNLASLKSLYHLHYLVQHGIVTWSPKSGYFQSKLILSFHIYLKTIFTLLYCLFVGKSTNSPFHVSSTLTCTPLNIVHFEIREPCSLNLLVVIDTMHICWWLYQVQLDLSNHPKSHKFNFLKLIQSHMETSLERKIKRFSTNTGDECLSTTLQTLLQFCGNRLNLVQELNKMV